VRWLHLSPAGRGHAELKLALTSPKISRHFLPTFLLPLFVGGATLYLLLVYIIFASDLSRSFVLGSNFEGASPLKKRPGSCVAAATNKPPAKPQAQNLRGLRLGPLPALRNLTDTLAAAPTAAATRVQWKGQQAGCDPIA
jgi:hypothetical protein